ncbi:LysR family transcriptional regulator [Pseudomonas sp. nanlin1]|uniref:LysR family transcriptional regulator n=1 Tax=Pseudomonas sp. nanlin1 TaxID=3040605 RepID=UPI00388E1424
MSPLNLTHLQTFAKVVAAGSFSAAADQLNLSQPAVSLQVRQLEARLSVRLIERVGRGIRPSSAGLALLGHIEHINAAVDDALREVSSHAQGVVGRIVIGTGATACIHLLPPMLSELRQRFPQLEVRVSIGNTDGVLKALEDNRLDLALVTLPAARRSLEVTPLLDDDFVAIFSSATAKPVAPLTPERLAALPLVVFEAGSSTRSLIDGWFGEAGVWVKPVMELGSIEAIKEMVAAGLGYSLVPRLAVAQAHHRRGLQVVELAPRLSRTLAIALRQDKPLTRGLREVLGAMRALG